MVGGLHKTTHANIICVRSKTTDTNIICVSSDFSKTTDTKIICVSSDFSKTTDTNIICVSSDFSKTTDTNIICVSSDCSKTTETNIYVWAVTSDNRHQYYLCEQWLYTICVSNDFGIISLRTKNYSHKLTCVIRRVVRWLAQAWFSE